MNWGYGDAGWMMAVALVVGVLLIAVTIALAFSLYGGGSDRRRARGHPRGAERGGAGAGDAVRPRRDRRRAARSGASRLSGTDGRHAGIVELPCAAGGSTRRSAQQAGRLAESRPVAPNPMSSRVGRCGQGGTTITSHGIASSTPRLTGPRARSTGRSCPPAAVTARGRSPPAPTTSRSRGPTRFIRASDRVLLADDQTVGHPARQVRRIAGPPDTDANRRPARPVRAWCRGRARARA